MRSVVVLYEYQAKTVHIVKIKHFIGLFFNQGGHYYLTEWLKRIRNGHASGMEQRFLSTATGHVQVFGTEGKPSGDEADLSKLLDNFIGELIIASSLNLLKDG